jgi:hypothetical protein
MLEVCVSPAIRFGRGGNATAGGLRQDFLGAQSGTPTVDVTSKVKHSRRRGGEAR